MIQKDCIDTIAAIKREIEETELRIKLAELQNRLRQLNAQQQVISGAATLPGAPVFQKQFEDMQEAQRRVDGYRLVSNPYAAPGAQTQGLRASRKDNGPL